MVINDTPTFEMSIGGYPGPFFNVTVHKDVLECRKCLEGVTDIVSLEVGDLIEWKTLMSFLATRKWKSEYINEEILDGTHWQLAVSTPEFQIQ